MEVGEHCTLESCHRLTFLPISCAYCRSLFCQSHFLPLQHRCSAPGAAEADRTLSDTEILKRVQRANARRVEIQRGEEATTSSSALGSVEGGPSRLPCQKVNCKRFSLQLDQPSVTPAKSPLGVSLNDGRHDWRPAVTHAAPRCDRCRGFFCVGHRSPLSHGCTALAPPTLGDEKKQQAQERKKKAQDVLNKHFPNRPQK